MWQKCKILLGRTAPSAKIALHTLRSSMSAKGQCRRLPSRSATRSQRMPPSGIKATRAWHTENGRLHHRPGWLDLDFLTRNR